MAYQLMFFKEERGDLLISDFDFVFSSTQQDYQLVGFVVAV